MQAASSTQIDRRGLEAVAFLAAQSRKEVCEGDVAAALAQHHDRIDDRAPAAM
jgi:hypothetical protein